MKSYLKTAAGIVLLTSVAASLQAAVSAGAGNNDELQVRPQSGETTPGIDGPNKSAVTSGVQSKGKAVEVVMPASFETFLEQVRADGKLKAAEAAYNLSILAANRKDYTLANDLVEESIQLNQSNPNYLALAADIAFLMQKYDEAVTYQLRVLEMARSLPEVDALQVAQVLDQLGTIYFKQGDYEKAKSSLMEGLQVREKLPGDSHLQVVLSLNNLASLAVFQDQPDVAEALLKRSLNIARDVSGPRHVNSATMLANLADFYQSEARLDEAEVLYEEAISIWVDSSVDPLTQAVGRNSLGRLFLTQRRFDEARLQFEQVLLLLKQDYALDHPYVQQAIKNLANLDAELERSTQKDDMYDELVRELSVRSPQHM